MKIRFTAAKETTIKDLLREKGFSKDIISHLLSTKVNIYIDGLQYNVDYKLKKGDVLEVVLAKETSNVVPVDKPIDIIFEDEYVLVVNKPQGISTIPSFARIEDNLAGRVKNYLISTDQNEGIHVINRLDVETQGIVVFAKNKVATYCISNGRLKKEYEGVVTGKLDGTGTINKAIKKIPGDKKHILSDDGKVAITEFESINANDKESLVKFNLITGRTHQIRIHMASIGHPLVGDMLYGNTQGDFYLKCNHIAFYLSLNAKEYDFRI